ncbi:MAG: L-serine ammonia-lyase [Pseudomonadota bacterium]
MAAVSVFDIFKIGVGPSSSHTVGPMNAARAFAEGLAERQAERVVVTLYGSLAFTGKGHGTDSAVTLGLTGAAPETLDPDAVPDALAAIRDDGRLTLPSGRQVSFPPGEAIVFNYDEELPRHTNGMRFRAFDAAGEVLAEEDYYSLGGGFIVRGDEPEASALAEPPRFSYRSSAELLEIGRSEQLSIADVLLANERCWRSDDEIETRLRAIWDAMSSCIDRGMATDGVLPGAMAVVRRAPKLTRRLKERGEPAALDAMEWVNVFAIAVNEENASGSRVVTSPTNGAAGVIPAVLRYYKRFVPGASWEGIRTFLLTAGAIGTLYKVNASISGAEMGCQGEVGVACSMAAGGLAAALGGNNDHVEEAAEIGMEHNLGLTCDPIGGLVQIPCIERNAMGAVKAINAARLAMHGDGSHKVTLDQVIATMRQTGLDMSSIYKETSRGGLAVNVPEC